MIRQWRVSITNIEIVNETAEPFDPFIRFIIGGDYYVNLKKKGGDYIKIPTGQMGKVFCTECINFLEAGDSKMLELPSSSICTTIYASYFQMMCDRLHVEVWDK